MPKAKSSKLDKLLLIKAIYAYFMTAIAIFFLVSAVVTGTRVLVYSMVFDQYPVPDERYYCNYIVEPIEGRESKVDQAECDKQITKESNLRKADDLIRTLAYTIVGAIVLVPHMYMAKNIHKEKS